MTMSAITNATSSALDAGAAQARQTAMVDTAVAAECRRRRSAQLAIAFGQGITVLLLFGIWQFASGRLIDADAVSNPVAVFTALWSLFASGRIWPDVWQTLIEVLAGFGLGSAIGLLLALAFALVPTAQTILRPFLIAFYAIPKIALAPLIVMWLGLETAPKIAIATTFVFFVVFMNAVGGIEAVNPQHVALARIMGANRATILRKIVLPSMLGFLLTGFRLAIPEALIGAVIGEFIASDKGLGHLVSGAAAQFNMAVSLAAIIVLLVMVAIGDGLLTFVEGRLLRFRTG